MRQRTGLGSPAGGSGSGMSLEGGGSGLLLGWFETSALLAGSVCLACFMTWLLLASQVLHGGATRDQSVTWVNSLPCVTGAYRGTHASWPFPYLPNSNPSGIMIKIRIASTLLALALPLVAQEPAAAQVEAMFYKAYYL